MSSLAPSSQPWVLVCGGFHTRGGMDRANLELASQLIETGHPVHLIGHVIDENFAKRPGVTALVVPRPLGSIALGEARLAKRGEEVIRQVRAKHPHAVLVANGGNCMGADINWVHYVHHASRFEDAGAPIGLRLKNRVAEKIFRRHEGRAIREAKLVIANSELTRNHVTELLGVDPMRTRTIYLAANADWAPPSEVERANARTWLQIPSEVPVACFVGALGHDRRKGFDTLWQAWKKLSADPTWAAHLVVAGGGRQVAHWRREADRMNGQVHVLGFTDRVCDVLAASDLLVSPVLYEPFGLNVMEAICRGVPAVVSANAGVAELYPNDLHRYLLDDPRDYERVVRMLRQWSTEVEKTRLDFAQFSGRLRQRTWMAMANEVIGATAGWDDPSAGDTLVAAQ